MKFTLVFDTDQIYVEPYLRRMNEYLRGERKGHESIQDQGITKEQFTEALAGIFSNALRDPDPARAVIRPGDVNEKLVKALRACLPFVRAHVSATSASPFEDDGGIEDRLAFDLAEEAIAEATALKYRPGETPRGQ